MVCGGCELEGEEEPIHLVACLQNAFKLTPAFDELLLGVLARDPRAVVVLIEPLRAEIKRGIRGVLQRMRCARLLLWRHTL